MGETVRITFFRKAVLVSAAVGVIVSLFYGCRKRQLIEPTRGMDISERYWIKVLLFDNIEECSISSVAGFSISDTSAGHRCDFASSSGPIAAGIKDGRLMFGEHVLGREAVVEGLSPFVLGVNGRLYRGRLKLSVSPDGQTFDVVNALPIEAYLAGVVGAEMPSYWEPAALSAQAIAARTYCWFFKNYRSGNRQWDVKSTQADQVYRGVSAETATIWEAVTATEGLVLMWRPEGGVDEVFPAYYSSACGGHTESSGAVFGRSYGPLVARACPYCAGVAKASFFSWPAVEYDLDEAEAKLAARYSKLRDLGPIKTIEAARTSDHDGFTRVTSVRVVGENGKSDILRGEDLRLTLDPSGMRIKSIACKISQAGGRVRLGPGKGFGHGVGMCQCGAQGMARSGKSARQILEFYYPGATIARYN